MSGIEYDAPGVEVTGLITAVVAVVVFNFYQGGVPFLKEQRRPKTE